MPPQPARGSEAAESPGAAEKKDAHFVLDGVQELERRRGSEDVKFRQVADHLVDFVARHPEHRAVIDQLGRYLAEVESRDHDHDAPTGSEGG
jgi:hypothetical protein